MPLGRRRRHKKLNGSPAKRKKEREFGPCLLCCKEADTVSSVVKISSGNEKECYILLLEALGVGSESFVNLIQDWGNGSFTFCEDCSAVIERSLLIIEEIKSLRQQLNRMRADVVKIFRQAVPAITLASSHYSETARRILVQCYQACAVEISDCPPTSGSTLPLSPCRTAKTERDWSVDRLDGLEHGYARIYKEEHHVTAFDKSEYANEGVGDDPDWIISDTEGLDIGDDGPLEDSDQPCGYSSDTEEKGKQNSVYIPLELLPRVWIDPVKLCSRKLRCPLCDVESSLLTFGQHTSSVHGLLYYMGVFACRRCGDVTRSCDKTYLSEFLSTHQQCKHTKELQCMHCMENFATAELIPQHYATKHPHSRKCNVCGQVFGSFSSVVQHQTKSLNDLSTRTDFLDACDEAAAEVQVLSTPKPKEGHGINCEICDEYLTQVTSEHTSKHGYVSTFGCLICAKCGKVEKRSEGDSRVLKDFLERHESCEEIPHATVYCSECKRYFDRPYNLAKHWISRHIPCSAIPCAFCGKTFNKLVKVSRHEYSIHKIRSLKVQFHNKEGLLKCQFCPTKHNSWQELEKHEWTHREYHDDTSMLPIASESVAGAAEDKLGQNNDLDVSNTCWKRFNGSSTGESEQSRSKGLYCSVCGLWLPSTNQVRRHRVKAHVASNKNNGITITKETELHLYKAWCEQSIRPKNQCTMCDQTLSTLETREFQHHVLRQHGIAYYAGLYGCRSCGDVFPTAATDKDTLLAFCNEHRNCEVFEALSLVKGYDCVCCLKNLGTFEDLMQHVKDLHMEELGPYCDICGRKFITYHSRKEHMETVHEKEIAHFRELLYVDPSRYPLTSNFEHEGTEEECGLCGNGFDKSRLEALAEHVTEQHGICYVSGVYGCSRCMTVYTRKLGQSLNDFSILHSACEQKLRVSCHTCSLEFDAFDDLIQHTKEIHDELVRFLCYFCGRDYKSIRRLRVHHERFHSERRLEETNNIIQLQEAFTENYDEVLQCPLCEEELLWRTPALVKVHMISAHNLQFRMGFFFCVNCAEYYDEKTDCSLSNFQQRHATCSQVTGFHSCRSVDQETVRKCFKCEKNVTPYYMTFHFRWHVAEPKRCELCEKTFNLGSLTDHYLREHQVRLSSMCVGSLFYPKTMKPVKKLVKLVEEVAKVDDIVCRICLKRFPLIHKILMQDHVKDTHQLTVKFHRTREAYGCECCEQIQIFTTADEIANTHSIAKQFSEIHGTHCSESRNGTHQCSYCESSHDSFQNLMEHTLKCAKSKMKYRCKVCSNSPYYMEKSTLDKHMKKHDPNDPSYDPTVGSVDRPRDRNRDMIPCPVCGITTLRTSRRKDVALVRRVHLNEAHGLEQFLGIFACIKCWETLEPSAGISVQEFVENHKCPEEISDESRWKCNLCPDSRKQSYLSIKSKISHISVKHVAQISYVCEHCGKNFKHKNSLNGHRRLHENPDAYKCPDPGCDKIFMSDSSLQKHLRVARGNKNMCYICGKEYSGPNELSNHLQAHAQIRNVKCKLCDKMFWNKRNMYSHIRDFHDKRRKDRFKNKRKKEKNADSND